ncbi:MAG TPA: NEW3 domain-containing protein [Candidatus Thermoplasmatota archaeon]|nr:NEW3 domain-containing protein [Candidatus Thermoplasmatota archaeon]
MRVPLTVTNQFAVAIDKAPVEAEIDLGKALIDGGWTRFEGPGGPITSGFRLDARSVRVVQVSSLGTFTGSGSEGRILGTVPSQVVEGLLGRTSTSAQAQVPYDASSHPVVTVSFRVPGILAAGQKATFEVYFDSLLNGQKAAADDEGPSAGALQALHGSTAGTRLYGLATAPQGRPLSVQVTALHPGTQVTVRRLQDGQFRTDGITMEGGNPVTLAAGETRVAALGPGLSALVRIDASAPVIAAVDPMGFVPSAQASLVGEDFRVKMPPASADGAAGLYLINPSPETARVRVTGGSVDRIYQVPGRLYGGSNLECSPGSGFTRLVPDSYRVHVESGGPIMVQLQPRAPQQLPTVDGAPTGTTFMATTQWSSASDCGVGRGQPLTAQALQGSTGLRISSLEDPVQFVPASSSPGPALQLPAPPAAQDAVTMDGSDARQRDRPVLFASTAPVRVFAGGAPTGALAAPLAGPLGGARGGVAFESPTPVVAVALYPGTHVTAQVRYSGGSSTLTRVLGQEGVLTIDRDADLGRVLWTSIVSDRPLAVYPLGGTSGFFAGVPGYLDTSTGPAEYRGRLIDLRSASGDDPVTATIKAGEQVSLAFVVANHGKGVGGSEGPTEAVHLSVSAVPEGWSASFDQTDVSLLPEGEATIHLTVRPPALASGDLPPAALRVTAASHDRPSVHGDADVVAFVKTSFAVGLWFLQPAYGPKSLPGTIAPGGTLPYPVYAQNLGSQPDTILFTAETPDGPGQATLRDMGGAPVAALSLEAGEIRPLQLVVQAGQRDGLLLTTVTAQSETAPSALDRILALTNVRAPSIVRITSPTPFQLLRDGQETRFQVRLDNQGDSVADIGLSLLRDAPSTWASSLFLVDPIRQTRVPATRISLDPHSSQDIWAAVQPPADATAGTLASFQVVAQPGSGTAISQPLTGVVAIRHAVVPDVSASLSAPPGTHVPLTMGVHSRSNIVERIVVRPSTLPAGWALGAPSNVAVARNTTALVQLNLTVAATALPGTYPVGIRLNSQDGSVVEARLNVTVAGVLSAGSAAGAVVEAQPGRQVAVQLAYANKGNVPLSVTLRATAEDPWVLLQTSAVAVPARANTTLFARWNVPRDTLDGLQVHKVVLHGEATAAAAAGGSVDAIREVSFAVGRPELQAQNTTVVDAPGATLVRSLVRNEGNRPAHDVKVILVDRTGATRATAEIARINPGSVAIVALALQGHLGEAVLRLDPDDTVVESNEADNDAPLAPPPQAAAAAVAPLVLLGLLAAARSRRR